MDKCSSDLPQAVLELVCRSLMRACSSFVMKRQLGKLLLFGLCSRLNEAV